MTIKALLLLIQRYFTLTRNIHLINGLLIGTIVVLAGSLIGSIINNEFLDTPVKYERFMPPESHRSDKPVSYSQFKDIIEQNVFDAEVSSAKESVVEVEKKAPAGDALSKILENLTLVGFYGGREKLCILYDKRKKQEEIYAVNEEIKGTGAFVDKIVFLRKERKVFIRLNDEVGVLEEKTDEEEKEPDTSKRTRETIRKAVAAQKPKPRAPSASSEYSSDGTEFYMRSSEVEHHLKDFAKLLNQARVVPYFENGKNAGYKIKSINKGSLYEKLGLRNNDVIKKVNGDEINSMEKAMMLFKAFRNEREISITLQRNRKELTLNYHIN